MTSCPVCCESFEPDKARAHLVAFHARREGEEEWGCGECPFLGSFDELATHCFHRRHDSGGMSLRSSPSDDLPRLLREVQSELGYLTEGESSSSNWQQADSADVKGDWNGMITEESNENWPGMGTESCDSRRSSRTLPLVSKSLDPYFADPTSNSRTFSIRTQISRHRHRQTSESPHQVQNVKASSRKSITTTRDQRQAFFPIPSSLVRTAKLSSRPASSCRCIAKTAEGRRSSGHATSARLSSPQPVSDELIPPASTEGIGAQSAKRCSGTASSWRCTSVFTPASVRSSAPSALRRSAVKLPSDTTS